MVFDWLRKVFPVVNNLLSDSLLNKFLFTLLAHSLYKNSFGLQRIESANKKTHRASLNRESYGKICILKKLCFSSISLFPLNTLRRFTPFYVEIKKKNFLFFIHTLYIKFTSKMRCYVQKHWKTLCLENSLSARFFFHEHLINCHRQWLSICIQYSLSWVFTSSVVILFVVVEQIPSAQRKSSQKDIWLIVSLFPWNLFAVFHIVATRFCNCETCRYCRQQNSNEFKAAPTLLESL